VKLRPRRQDRARLVPELLLIVVVIVVVVMLMAILIGLVARPAH
jgi:hypothetical protein